MRVLTSPAALILILMSLPAQAQHSARCASLFKEQGAIDTCVTMLNMSSLRIEDDELRARVSQMVYGVTTAEMDRLVADRQAKEQETAAAEEARLQEEDQCYRLFSPGAERDTCRTLRMLTMRERTDIVMINAVRERLGKPPITGAEREEIIRAEGTRQEAFAAAQREREKAEAEEKSRRDKEAAKQRAIVEANRKKPIPKSWYAFAQSSNPEDRRLVVAIEKMKWWEVCRDFGRELRANRDPRRLAALREFLLSDKTINGADLANVKSGNVAVGMTTCGVYASLDLPNKINQTTRAQSTSAQIIYRDRGVYVYTEARPNDGNGIVTAIQH